MLHGKAMTISVAYDVYKECCEGGLDVSWRRKPVTFFRFREKLAHQMLTYPPKDRKCPGDEMFRVATRQHKDRRTPSPPRRSLTPTSASASSSSASSNGVGKHHLQAASRRLCGFLDKLEQHEESLTKLNNHQACVMCGGPAYYQCINCPNTPTPHVRPHKDRKVSCFIRYHNTSRFGIT